MPAPTRNRGHRFAAYPRCSADLEVVVPTPSAIERNPEADGVLVGSYSRSLGANPQVAVGDERTTLQTRYIVVAEGRCAFVPRFAWAFANGRPSGYKGILGWYPVVFRPMGLAEWHDRQFIAKGYFWLLPVVVSRVALLAFVVGGIAVACSNPTFGNWLSVLVSAALVSITYWWQWSLERRWFRTFAEEVATDLEATGGPSGECGGRTRG